jgi:hypothetical protein
LIIADSDRPALPAWFALVLLGLTCVLPFLCPVFWPPISTFYGEAVAVTLGLAAVAAMLTRSLWTGVRLPRISLVFLGFAMLMALQFALGRVIYGQLNLLGALYLLWAAALAMLANRLVRVFGAATLAATLAWFLIAGTLASALIGLMQLLGAQTPLTPFLLPQVHGRIYGNTGQPNHYASYLCLGLVSAGYLWSTRRLRLILTVTVCAVILTALAGSGSRAVWVYFMAFVVFSAWMGLLRPSADFRRLLVFSLAIMGGLFAVQWMQTGLTPQPSIVAETIGARMQTEGMSSPIRMRFWNEAWLMFRSAPVLGVGFKQFAWNNFLFAGQIAGRIGDEGIIDHAHNLVFQVAAEFGACGLVVLLGGLGWWGWSLRRAKIEPPLWWMGAVLGVLGLHSMLEYPLWYAYFLGLAALTMGAAECEAPATNDGPGGRIILCAAVLLGALACANVFRDYRVMQSLQRSANREPTAVSSPSDVSVRVMLDMQRSSLFAPLIEFALARRMLLNQDHLKDKIVLNGRAMRFQPSSDFAYRQALLLAMSGDPAATRAQWDLAVANYPSDRKEAMNVAQALDQAGERGMKELLRYAQRIDEKGNQ